MDANRMMGPQFAARTPSNQSGGHESGGHGSARRGPHGARVRAGLGRVAALVAILAAAGAITNVVTPTRLFSQTAAIVKVDVNIVAKGYRASKLIGTSVSNEKKEKIGSIDDIIIDTNRDLFAVLQVGGFLGLGAHLVAVPYQSLKIDDEARTIELPGATKDALKGVAEFRYRS